MRVETCKRDFACDSCGCLTFRGEEMGYYDGWKLCILCFKTVEQAIREV